VELLLWSERKKNNKVDKWEGGMLVFSRSKGWILSPIEVQRDPLHNVLGGAEI
jgi:hypothetical protein